MIELALSFLMFISSGLSGNDTWAEFEDDGDAVCAFGWYTQGDMRVIDFRVPSPLHKGCYDGLPEFAVALEPRCFAVQWCWKSVELNADGNPCVVEHDTRLSLWEW